MRKIILVLLIFICLKSYSQTIDKDYIKILSTRFKYNDVYVVLQIQNGKMQNDILMTNHFLHNYYEKLGGNKKKGPYILFLERVFNNSEIIYSSKLNPQSYTIINSRLPIYQLYEKYGINYIIKTFLISENGKLKNKPMEMNTLNTLIKILFNNKYLILFSDYSGNYYFVKC